MTSETYYVDELLKAEEEANKIIKNAQKEREKKLKQARLQAEEQVQNYRRRKQQQFKKMQQRKQDRQFELKLKRTTDEEIEVIRNDYTNNREKVIGIIVENVLNVDLSIPITIKQKFAKKQK